MESSMAVVRLQSCACPCKHIAASLDQGRGHHARQRVDSNSLRGGVRDLGSPFNLELTRRRLPTTTRCLYSPIVESFEAPRIRPFIAVRDGNDGGAMLASSSSLSYLRPALVERSSELNIVHQESSVRNDYRGNEGSAGDDSSPAPQDPVAAEHGDSSFTARASDAGHDCEARRISKSIPQTMSLTHGFRSAANQGVNCAIGVSGRPIVNATRIGGPTGLVMGLAVAGLGIATALQKATETQPQKLCTRCDGYGVECCDVCCGAGQISYEGKAHRTTTCPRCFGSRLKKCPRCDGCRVKKDSTPLLQHLKATPKPPPQNK